MKRREFITLLGGAAAAWPLAARAQRADRLKRIAVIEAFTENDSEGQARIGSLRESLAKLGWINGRTAQIEYRWGAIDLNLARAYAAEFTATAPDVIFVDSAPVVAAIRDQIHTTPIVFIQAGDPVQANSVQSFARPGGNLTGFLQYEPTIAGKYLQLLKDIAPNVDRVAVMQFENSTWRGDFSAIQKVAQSFSVMPISTIVHNDEEIEQAIRALAQEPNGALIALSGTNIALHRDQIIASAARHALPAIYSGRPYVASGGLRSYGVDNIDLYSRAALYVDRILKGEKPSDLPVQAPTKFELVINLKTAKADGRHRGDRVMRRREFITLLGGAAVWPLAARGQQLAMPVIGYLSAGSSDLDADNLRAFRQGLSEASYGEGRNVAIAGRRATMIDCRRSRPI
jgi:putative ABC transport system substrate-binding protein